MDITIIPKQLQGSVHVIPSKSQAHRVLICAAFSDKPTHIFCSQSGKDLRATVHCLQALGATIQPTPDGYFVQPANNLPKEAILPCGESGSTLRFLLPIVGALGVDATFFMEGRLSQRPLSPLWEEMERMGCRLSRSSQTSLRCYGRLRSGKYTLTGNVSSQFVSGLLLAFPLMKGNSCITIIGDLESRSYVDMTQAVIARFQVDTSNFAVTGSHVYKSPGSISIDGDWSNGAYFHAANSLGSALQIYNLDPNSLQGDRIVTELIPKLRDNMVIEASAIPDLVPILSVVAAANSGCTFTNIQRLRLKESDRVASIIQMLKAMGIRAQSTETTLTIFPGKFRGGVVDAVNDHRIAMSAAIAATIASDPVQIIGAGCVDKSYPLFWDEFARLGGIYE